jgi:hypothetical protein
MNRKTRLWSRDQDDDPLSGLVNLFDLWIVVVVALILMLVQSADRWSAASDKSPLNSQGLSENLVEIRKFRETDSQLTGRGIRLGTAYRLQSGEIVYAPD